jgi:hypothetical protein
LAAAQSQLLDGIHLPDVVRMQSPLFLAGTAPARRRRRELVATKPTLQSSHAGASLVFFLQQNAD